jgi:hypothetical protein
MTSDKWLVGSSEESVNLWCLHTCSCCRIIKEVPTLNWLPPHFYISEKNCHFFLSRNDYTCLIIAQVKKNVGYLLCQYYWHIINRKFILTWSLIRRMYICDFDCDILFTFLRSWRYCAILVSAIKATMHMKGPQLPKIYFFGQFYDRIPAATRNVSLHGLSI